MASARVIVFLDYQNVYNGAREAFDLRGHPSRHGQIDPLKLAELIVARHPEEAHLAGVHLYRGRPDSARQSQACGANMRQSDARQQRGRSPSYAFGFSLSESGERCFRYVPTVVVSLDAARLGDLSGCHESVDSSDGSLGGLLAHGDDPLSVVEAVRRDAIDLGSDHQIGSSESRFGDLAQHQVE